MTIYLGGDPLGRAHGALRGLTLDDHPQYLNEERADLIYSLLGHTHSSLVGEISILTNGDLVNPELVFANGDVIIVISQ